MTICEMPDTLETLDAEMLDDETISIEDAVRPLVSTMEEATSTERPSLEPTDPCAEPATDETKLRWVARTKAILDWETNRVSFLDQKRHSEEYLSERVLAHNRLKEQAKYAGKMADDAVESLKELLSEGQQYFEHETPPEEVLLRAEQQAIDRARARADESAKAAGTLAAAVASNQSPENPDAWKAASITALSLKPGVEKTLLEAGVATIGALETLRAGIATGREKWPKGIGAAKVTAIEDAVIAWLSKERDKAVSAEALIPQPLPATDGEPAADPEAVVSLFVEALGADQIVARADFLDTGEENALGAILDPPNCWDSGREAFGLGYSLEDCPYVPGDEQDDWLRGFMDAEEASAEGGE